MLNEEKNIKGFKKQKRKFKKTFFVPKCYYCGKNCTETGIRRFISYGTMTYFDMCAECYCKVNTEQKKKYRYKNWLKGERVFITSMDIYEW